MKNLFDSFYRDRVVLVTGHTGFKGGWLVTWLKLLGAKVVGFALPPEEGRQSLYHAANVQQNMVSIFGDIRDFSTLSAAVVRHKPEIVFHLAAQPLVRRSYREPLETLSTNIMGTAHVLEAVKQSPSVRAAVMITSDKCYDNKEWVYAYRENDPMGGFDPYSASKGAAEIVTASYRNSFFLNNQLRQKGVGLASARAGNVIGGGDWSEDRLVPDCVRSLAENKTIQIRFPDAIRPWQHVLEPLSGYLWLAAQMNRHPGRFDGPWNFGPENGGNMPVRQIVDRIIAEWGVGGWVDMSRQDAGMLHEDNTLRLDCTKAATHLEWRPILSLSESIRETVKWYRRFCHDSDFDGLAATVSQIESYVKAAHDSRAPWTSSVVDFQAISEI